MFAPRQTQSRVRSEVPQLSSWKEEASERFLLFWDGLYGLAKVWEGPPKTSLISEFPETVGGMQTGSQLAKEI